MDAKIAQVNRTLHAVYLDYERQLRLADQSALAEQKALERAYSQLLPSGVISALVPQVRLLHHYATSPERERHGNPRTHRFFSNISRMALLFVYRSHLQHAKTTINAAISGGARNVL